MYRPKLLASYVGGVARSLLHRDPFGVINDQNKYADWILADRLPTRYPRELLPGIASVKVSVDVDVGHPFELPCGERTVLAALLTCLQARTVFEIGTYTGTTTRIMADAIDGVVHTLDLPPSENSFDPDIIEQVGKAFRDDPRFRGRITQHFGNSRTFDFSPWRGKVDLMFVDGSHERDDVIADSRTAVGTVRPGGIVVWDDYQPAIPGVVQALHTLKGELDIVHVVGTRLAMYRKPEGRA